MIIQLQKPSTIILIGDNGIDRYQFGKVPRVSPEAPVPVFQPLYLETKPGMAANVKENFRALGMPVVEYLGKPSTKTRLIDVRSKQHLVRVDEDVINEPLKFSDIKNLDGRAIVISDYNKGFVSYELVQKIRESYNGPIFVDTKKKDLSKFKGCIIKINSSEYDQLTGFPSNDTELIVTQGEDGALWNGRQFEAEKVEVADVCGAGDTFLAALVYQYLKTKELPDAIEFAIKASAITVQHTGVYAPTLKEILK